jgi:hypothetical protein
MSNQTRVTLPAQSFIQEAHAKQGHMNCNHKTFVKPEEGRHAKIMAIYLSKNSTPDGLEIN